MKILQVTNFFKPSWESGGPARVAYEISKKLIERGHEVTVYTTDGFKSRLQVEKNEPVDVDGIKTYYFRNLSSYLSREMVLPTPYYLPVVARKEINDFDVIHIHEHRTLLAVIIHRYAKKHNIPYILQAHGSVLPFFQKQRLKKLYDLAWGDKILKDASKVIALTKTEAEQYKKMDVDENKIEIVPNGIDLSEYENLPERGRFRKKYLISDDEKMILYLGRIHKIKGIDLLVKAFADLIKELDDVRLVIVGPDDGFLSTLEGQIEDLNIGVKILFTGPLYGRDKLNAYIDADVYVLPSVYEIFGITVLEACACGTPVIVTDQCEIAEWIGNNGGYVIQFHENQLKDTLFEILTDEKFKKQAKESSKKVVEEHFAWSKIAEQMGSIYKEIIQTRV